MPLTGPVSTPDAEAGSAESRPVLTLRGQSIQIDFARGGHVFESADFQATAGHLTCIVGPTGVGKSNFVRAMTRDSTFTIKKGVFTIEDHQGARPLRTIDYCYLPQKPEFYDERSVAQTIRDEYTILAGSAELVEQAFQMARFPDSKLPRRYGGTSDGRQPVGRLSVGERARFALGLKIMHPTTKVFVIDEVDSPLDAATRADVVESLRDLARDHIVLLVTHASDFRSEDRIVPVAPLPEAQRTDKTRSVATLLEPVAYRNLFNTYPSGDQSLDRHHRYEAFQQWLISGAVTHG